MTNISRSMPSYNGVFYAYKPLDITKVIEAIEKDQPLTVEILDSIRRTKRTPIEKRELKLTIHEAETTDRKKWNFEATVEDPVGMIRQVLFGFVPEATDEFHWMFSVFESAFVLDRQRFSPLFAESRRKFLVETVVPLLAQVA